MGTITFLGVEGSGKNVLTMALVNLFKAHAQEGWFLRPETRSAFRFVEQVPPVLEPGSLPHQTTALRHLAMSVVKDGEVQRVFDILDYPGEIYRLAFLDAKDDPDPATFQARVEANQEDIRTLLSHLQGSDRVYVLFNLADAQDLAHNAQNLDAVWVTNACLDYLHRLPSRPEIALLLTQIDLYGDLNNPTLSPRRIAEQALPLIARNFPNLSIQAVSALGPASGPFGVDNILANCLKDTPAVEAYLALDLNAALITFQDRARAFAKVPTVNTRAAAEAASTQVVNLLSSVTQTGIWFLPPHYTKAAGHHINALLQDWLGLLCCCSSCEENEHISETLLASFNPLTQEGEEWKELCQEHIREEHRQAEEQAHLKALKHQGLILLLWLVPILAVTCWISRGSYYGLVEIKWPEEYSDFFYAVDGASPRFLITYLWVAFLGLYIFCYIKGVKIWREAEKRRRMVVTLGGVVTLWLVLFTLLLA